MILKTYFFSDVSTQKLYRDTNRNQKFYLRRKNYFRLLKTLIRSNRYDYKYCLIKKIFLLSKIEHFYTSLV